MSSRRKACGVVAALGGSLRNALPLAVCGALLVACAGTGVDDPTVTPGARCS